MSLACIWITRSSAMAISTTKQYSPRLDLIINHFSTISHYEAFMFFHNDVVKLDYEVFLDGNKIEFDHEVTPYNDTIESKVSYNNMIVI